MILIATAVLFTGCTEINKLKYDYLGDDKGTNEVLEMVEAKKFDEAFDKICDILDSDYFTFFGVNEVAYHFLDEGKFEEGVYILHRLDRVYPDNESVANNLSWGYAGMRKFTLANYYADRTLAQEPNEAIEYVNKGTALSGLDKNEEALTYYEKALQITPTEEYALSSRIAILHELERYDEAILAYADYEQAYPEKAKEMLFYLCDAHVKTKAIDKAISLYRDAFESEMTDTGPLYSIANLYWTEFKDYNKALEVYLEIAAVTPDDPWAYLNSAACLAGEKRDREACEYLKKAIALDDEVLYEMSYYDEFTQLKESPYYAQVFQ